MSPRPDRDFKTPGAKMHTAFCTCGWWDLFKSEKEAQKAMDTHRSITHHFEMRTVPPKEERPGNQRMR